MKKSEVNFETTFESPIGLLTLRSINGKLCGIWTEKSKHFLGKTKNLDFKLGEDQVLTQTKKFLEDYFKQKNPDPFLIPLKPIGTGFQKKIWEVLREIPYGQVSSYYEVAKKAGTKGFQAVGQAVSNNPFMILVPCHRVLTKDGRIGGYAGGIELKRYLLALEGFKA